MNYRPIFIFILGVAFVFMGLGIVGLFRPGLPTAKLINTASGLLALASLAQLQVSGWFDKVMQVYGDESQYPFGPPSYITRQIIDNPDHPFQTLVRNTLFFHSGTGVWLAVASIILAIVAAWL
ncbi:hypothetical protein A9K65_026700 [Mesorhizobium sp. WSM1497]|uniref:hypothetical protein n=1 Tax=Mesorhizobium sp. WSM1497 TaxID=278153 RepID=UPI0007EC8ACB|nr:hypothetical protein [Mesorhizobium sp. WSM1497]ARP66535.1 hypothetical protein A9K65_026700 [Mesorhizobium sp. WSM1497]